MSDDGLMNVEDDGPAVEAVVETPPEPAVEAAPPEQTEEQAAEVEAVEVAGKKYVPVAAVISERKQRQALQEKANRTDALEAEMNNARPYVEFLKNNPDLLKPRQPPAPTTFGAPVPDPIAADYAKKLDLYTPEGQPDVQRASEIRQMIIAESQRIAQQAMAPVQEQTYQDQSARNFQTMLQLKDADGRTPDPKTLATVWRTMSAQQTADPNVAAILAATALGMDSMQKKRGPAPPPNAPLVTEGAGNAARRPALSALEASIARERGITESKWAEHTKGFQPGRSNTLED